MEKFKPSKVSEMLGMNAETLRYYERIGLAPEPGRSAGGHRAYSADDLAHLQFIRRARLLGFSIDEIRTLLDLTDPADRLKVRAMAVERLKKLKAELEEKQTAADLLQKSIAACEAHSCGCQIMDMLNGPGFPDLSRHHAES